MSRQSRFVTHHNPSYVANRLDCFQLLRLWDMRDMSYEESV
jgi:hypothetical protein